MPLFGRNFKVMTSANSQFDLLFGVRVDAGVENSKNINLDPTFLFDFYTQHRPLLHRFATSCTDRQTDTGLVAIGETSGVSANN